MICYKNIVDIALYFFLIPPQDFGNHNSFFFFSSHFRQLGWHNSYFLSQFPTILATWLPQLVNHSGTPPSMHWGTSRAGAGQDMNFGNLITEIHFFLPPYHITHFSSLSYFSYNFGKGVAEIQSLSSFS